MRKKISIITINYNNLDGLKRTVESVIKQTYKEFEYIIIDGGSTDGSKEYIQATNKYFDYWVSESDNGIYNAMNKGILQAKGDYLLFLNSGDKLCNNDIFNHIKENSTDFDVLYGDLIFSEKSRIRKYNEPISFKYFMNSALGHPSILLKRDLFINKRYNEEFKIVSDWIFLFEAFLEGRSFKYLNFVISEFEGGGISDNEELVNIERTNYINQKFPIIGDEFLKLQNDLYSLSVQVKQRKLKYKIKTVLLKLRTLWR
jgi:glycosyltransferase involved in cell wall biosynthesis